MVATSSDYKMAKIQQKCGVKPENMFYRKFDTLQMPLYPTAERLQQDIVEAWERSDKDALFYVLLDEVQDVEGWERVVRRLHSQDGIDVYLTGSNASILSSDLATLLSGRSIALDVYPLGFAEYVDFSEGFGSDSMEKLFANYVRYGGMPSLFSLMERSEDFIERELSAIFDTVLLNDVALRMGIRDMALLERLVTYLFSTSGNLFSTRKITGALASAGRKTSNDTVDNYIKALEEAFALVGVQQTGLAGKRVLSPLRKFYAADTGLRNLPNGFAPGDFGLQLEGVVFMELLRRGYRVEVGPLDRAEVDFVAMRRDEKLYVQVAESMLDAAVYERELAPLRLIPDSFPKMVLALDRFRMGTTEDGIRVANLMDWLLGA